MTGPAGPARHAAAAHEPAPGHPEPGHPRCDQPGPDAPDPHHPDPHHPDPDEPDPDEPDPDEPDADDPDADDPDADEPNPDDPDPDEPDADEPDPDDTGPADRRSRDDLTVGAAGLVVAGALADAFLAGGWTRGELSERGGRVLGSRPRWLAGVIGAVLAAYRVAPGDRPRELTAFVAATHPFRFGLRQARRRSRPVRVRERLVTPVRRVRAHWDTPAVDDLAALARLLTSTVGELDWLADRREINRHAADERLRLYRYTWHTGRLIEAPKPRLRAVQRRLLDHLLGRVPVHGCAHGFVPGRSAHSFAAPHTGRATVVRLDLVSFFASVTATRVYGLLRLAGYPEPVAHTLTALCTTRTPAGVLRAAPTGLPQRAHRLALLRGPHLPQGAPTSPALANLCAYRLDRRLAGLAERFGARYTRYADDLAFSGDFGPHRAHALVAHVHTVAAREGFRVHPAKTRIRGRADRQWLAGLVVNDRPAVPRPDYDRLRAILHHAATAGLAAANRDGHPDFAGHLAGRVAWVGHRHPRRAEKLRALLDAALRAAPPAG